MFGDEQWILTSLVENEFEKFIEEVHHHLKGHGEEKISKTIHDVIIEGVCTRNKEYYPTTRRG